jgi:transcriptional regulator with XRE-family HTH domain
MDTGRNAERLDEAMRQRRVQLGLSWEDIATAADITSAHLRRIRVGQYLPRDTTAAKLERAFRWSPGSIDTVLAGGEPTPLDPAPASADKERPDATEIEIPEAEVMAVIAHRGELSPALQRILRRVIAEAFSELEELGTDGQKPDNRASGNGT